MNTQEFEKNRLHEILFIMLSSITLGFLFNYFFIKNALGISFSIYAVLVILALVFIFYNSKKYIPKNIVLLIVGFIFFSTMVFIRTSELLTALNIIASTLFVLLIVERISGKSLRQYFLNDYFRILSLPLIFPSHASQIISGVSKFPQFQGKKRINPQIWRGIAMTLPVLVIFLILFSSADLVFRKHLLNIVDFDFESLELWRLLIVILVSYLILGFFSYAIRKVNDIEQGQNNTIKSFGHIEITILLVSINILFLIFVILQFAYLFGGENNLIAEGITYATYARRGFFELIAVAIIAFLILWDTEKRIKRNNEDTHVFIFKLLNSTLVLQVILIMVSAFKRLSLYEGAFGFTTLRLYSHVFIVFLGIIFLIFLYKTLFDKKENTFVFQTLLVVSIFLFGMNVLNPDAFIAKKNIERYQLSGQLDLNYLSELSTDAIPTTIQILDIRDEVVEREFFAYKLYWQWHDLKNSSRFSNWQSFNISRVQAEKIFQTKLKVLEQNKNLY